MAPTGVLHRRRNVVHVFLDVVTIAVSACVFIPHGRITNQFDGNCLLYSDVHIKMEKNHSTYIDLAKTTYANGKTCDYATFISVIVAIHSVIWIWFFAHMDSLKTKNGSIFNLLLPALLTRLILVVCVFIASIELTEGFSAWCKSMVTNINTITHTDLSCQETQTLPWKSRSISKFYTLSVVAMISSWLLVTTLLISCGVTILHIYGDFLLTMDKELRLLKREEDERDSSSINEENKSSSSHQTSGNMGSQQSISPLLPSSHDTRVKVGIENYGSLDDTPTSIRNRSHDN